MPEAIRKARKPRKKRRLDDIVREAARKTWAKPKAAPMAKSASATGNPHPFADISAL